MPQFVKNGPDLPERLLQAHEDGKVAFFCGAGISYPAKLPGFKGLVEGLYDSLGIVPNAIQRSAIKSGQYDTCIGLVESEIVGGKDALRAEMAKILTPDLGASNATTTHESLLSLSKTRNGLTRLITTNFDRIFEAVISEKSLEINRYQAPLLPVPKSRLNGLVYLHGLFGSPPQVEELSQLIVSSGDFGRAYLTERWAARFVSELFRNYSVCFVGYSINDPVLRYMTDAIAADRQLGESLPEMFAFGSYSKNNEQQASNEWKAKNVTPILYKEFRRHAYLHKTMRAWAGVYSDGVRGKERIVADAALARPLASTRQDNYVDRLLWAVSDPSGLPAKHFAEINPVPVIDWLKPLSEPIHQHGDLDRFGVSPDAKIDKELKFSLVHRPSPYQLAQPMSLVDSGAQRGAWDKVMEQLAHWLVRHLGDPELLLWMVNRGGQPHENLVRVIDGHLDMVTKLQNEGDNVHLERFLADAPNAIPSPKMRALWRMFLTGRVKSQGLNTNIFRWRDRFIRDGLTASTRLDLRNALLPLVSVSRSYRHSSLDSSEENKAESAESIIRCEIELSSDFSHSSVADLRRTTDWNSVLVESMPDFTMLLSDALDLENELNNTPNRSDYSYIYQPSISESSQNRGLSNWTVLIDLARDAWLAVAEKSPDRAAIEAETWMRRTYPLFRRLAFFAAAHENVVPNRQALGWLLSEEGRWLWAAETKREAIRLMVELAKKSDEDMLREIETSVLAGPPRSIFVDDIEGEQLIRVIDSYVWLRLSKITDSGVKLGHLGEKRLKSLSAKYPSWKLEDDQRDEFSFWMGSGEDHRVFVPSPTHRRELVEWLKEHPGSDDHWGEDGWRQRCQDSFPATSCALCFLAKEDIWPTERWREALQVWTEEKYRRRSWRYMGPVLFTASDEVLLSIAHEVSRWLEYVSKTFDHHETLFMNFAKRLLSYDTKDGVETDEPLMRAINHPVGKVTEALLNWWLRRDLNDGQGLPYEVEPIFSEICDTSIDKYRHGRVLLASNVIALYRVDQQWTTQNLLVLFQWRTCSEEDKAAWDGFLWSPRLYYPLLDAVKPDFLETAKRFGELGKVARQYASLLTFVALEPNGGFTTKDLAAATRALPAQGLNDSADALIRALEGAAEQHADYWLNRVDPYLRNIWPQSKSAISPEISEKFGRLCIAADSIFPTALARLQNWLIPVNYPDLLVRKLCEGDICRLFPSDALEFLSLIVDSGRSFPPLDLGHCLQIIGDADSSLKVDPRFEKLDTFLRRSR